MSLISRSALLLSLALGASAYAVDASSSRWPEGMRWEPQGVRAPVALSDLRAAEPFVVGNPPEPLGKAMVASGQGAAVFLSALQTLRVTGPTEGLRFVRIPRALRPTDPVVEVEEPGIPVSPGVWYLAEPAGAGSVWFITSERSASIEVSRPAPVASGNRGLEREALLAWVNGDGPKAPTPLDARVRTELELEAELTASLLAAEPEGSPLREAARAYRTASALRRWAEVEPIDPKTSRTRPLALPGRAARLPDSPLAYTRFDAPEGELSVTLEGPGVLELQARALVGGAPTRLLSVEGADPVQFELDARRPAPIAEHASALPSEGEGRKIESGEPVGALSANRILLAPGKRTYRLRWSGGALVLRGWSAQRRPTTAELLTGRTDWTDYANRAWAKLSNDQTAAAELLRRALAELDSTKRPLLFTARNLEGLPSELRARLLVLRAETAPSKEAISAAAEATALQGSRLSTLGWSTQLRLARLALDHAATAIAASLLAAPEFPENGTQIAEAAALVERLPGAAALRSRTLAALELAYRREPLSPEIRSQYLRTWFRESRWSTALPLASAGAPAPRAQAWLDVQPDADETLRGEGALSPLRPGAQVGVTARGPASAPSVLRAFLFSPRPSGKVATLVVGTSRFPLRTDEALVPVEIALPPGAHTVRLEADGDTTAFFAPTMDAAPVEGSGLAYARTLWPLTDSGSPVHHRIASPQLATPVRVQLRAAGVLSRPVAIWMHTDVGAARRIVLRPSAASPTSLPLDGGSTGAPAPAAFSLTLPALTREVWFEPEKAADAQLFASMAVRADAGSSVDSAPWSPPVRAADPKQTALRVLELSRTLASTADRRKLLLDRAELLLSLEEPGLARADLASVLSSPEVLDAGARERLERLIDAVAADSDQVPFHAALDRPTLLSPALPALGDEAALRGPSAEGTALARYLSARALAREGKLDDATIALVRLYRDTGIPQVGLEALRSISRGPISEATAPLALAVSAQVAEWAEPSVLRRVRADASRATRWGRLVDAEKKAGTLSLSGAGEDAIEEVVRKAIVGSPWTPEETSLVRAGTSQVLQLDVTKPRELGAEVFCGQTEAGPCVLALRVDGSEVATRTVDAGERSLITTYLSAGPHQLELLLANGAARYAGARFVSIGAERQPEPLSSAAHASLLRSRVGDPVVMTVLGPTVLRLDARRVQGARSLEVRAEPLTAGADSSQTIRVELPADADPANPKLGTSREALVLLPGATPYRVAFEPSEGEAVLAVQTALPAQRPAPIALASTGEMARPEPLRFPALAPWLSLPPDAPATPGTVGGLGMLSAELAARSEMVDEGEIFGRALRTGLEATFGYRRELLENRLWLRFEPRVRLPQGTTAVVGADTGLELAQLPLGLRMVLKAGGARQEIEGDALASAHGRLSLQRYVALSPDWALLPQVAFSAERFFGESTASSDLFDRDVYWRYGADHPQQWSPRLTLRWHPLQDQLFRLVGWGTSNADLVTIDHASTQLSWNALLGGPLAPRLGLSYEASYRFVDAHRAEAYLRHAVGGEVAFSLWPTPAGRAQLVVADQVLASAPFGAQNVFSVGLRFDWSGGRGLRDLGPTEEDFDELLDPVRNTAP